MIGIVAHDAGGAEIISSYVKANNLKCKYTLDGPAKYVFERKIGAINNSPLEELISECNSIICGTSLISKLEWTAIKLAKKANKKSVAVIDHWVNYRERFIREGLYHFPDEVWLGDQEAVKLANSTLQEPNKKFVPNAYFEDLKQQLKTLQENKDKNNAGTKLLYACEPLREPGIEIYNNPLHWGYTEEDAVKYFLENVSLLSSNIEQIELRPHPKEEHNKYQWAVDEYKLPIITQKNESLFERIVEADIIAGCATMALYVGLLANKRVISCIPPGAKTIPLPHQEIEKLEEIIEKKLSE